MAKAVLGVDRLRARLRALPEAIKADMRAAVVDGATEITGQMKRLLDDDKDLQHDTGWAFGQARNLPSGALTSGAGSSSDSSGDLIVTIFSGSFKAFWARWREFGTHAHSLAKGADRSRGKLQDKGPHSPGERASPYFFPIWRANKAAVKRKIAAAVNATMRRIAASK